MKPDNTIRNAEILRRRLAGEFPKDIAPAMGLNRNIVIGVCGRAGVTLHDTTAALVRGADCFNARLTESQVAQIRKRYVPHCRENGAAAIAREFECSSGAILSAVKRETWRHVV